MKKLLLLLYWFASLVQASGQDYQHVVLQKFPSLQPVSVAGLAANKPTYIKLWASWCKPCMEQMPHFQQLFRQYGDRVNFVAVNININEQRSAVKDVISKFGLTMPVWMDQQGQMALALGLVGTPFSVLFNRDGQQVYSSHVSDAALDGLMQRLADGQLLSSEQSDKADAMKQQQLLAPFQTGEQLLFITATWCDWYLADTRPEMAKQCQQAQQQLNAVAALLPDAHWVGLVNHLWTDQQALSEFNQKYQMNVPFQIDQYGVLFQHFNVHSIPVLLQLKEGQVIKSITDFSSPSQVINQLQP